MADARLWATADVALHAQVLATARALAAADESPCGVSVDRM